MSRPTLMTNEELLELDAERCLRELGVVAAWLRDLAEELPTVAAKFRELKEEANLVALYKSTIQSVVRTLRETI